MDRLFIGDALEALKQIPSETVDTCVTSPPYYGLRDYGADGQIGLEKTPDEYIDRLVDVFHEVKRTLKKDGTLWIVISDSYAGSGKGAHFATFPPELIEPCILAGSRAGGTVLDPFLGSGTTAEVAHRLGRECIGIELNPDYKTLIIQRTGGQNNGKEELPND